jgi:hypothetical protein
MLRLNFLQQHSSFSHIHLHSAPAACHRRLQQQDLPESDYDEIGARSYLPNSPRPAEWLTGQDATCHMAILVALYTLWMTIAGTLSEPWHFPPIHSSWQNQRSCQILRIQPHTTIANEIKDLSR